MTERISDMTIDHYRGQSQWYMKQMDGVAKMLLDVVLALEVEPSVRPVATGEPLFMGTWTRSDILARVAVIRGRQP